MQLPYDMRIHALVNEGARRWWAHLNLSSSLALLQKSITLLLLLALEMVCLQFLSTMANFFPSEGSYIRIRPYAARKSATRDRSTTKHSELGKMTLRRK